MSQGNDGENPKKRKITLIEDEDFDIVPPIVITPKRTKLDDAPIAPPSGTLTYILQTINDLHLFLPLC